MLFGIPEIIGVRKIAAYADKAHSQTSDEMQTV